MVGKNVLKEQVSKLYLYLIKKSEKNMYLIERKKSKKIILIFIFFNYN